MADALELPAIDTKSDWADLSDLRDALSEQLLREKADGHLAVIVGEEHGGFDVPARLVRYAGAAELHLSDETDAQLRAGDVGAIAKVAHLVVHSIGEGPGFPYLEDQLLEEAITETIAQAYLPAFAKAFGVELELLPLFETAGDDLKVTRPTAVNVAVERFARIVTWIEGADIDQTGAPQTEPEELEGCALTWAVRLKALPGNQRFKLLAIEAATLGGDADDVGAEGVLTEYLQGYMKALERSRTGYAGLRYAAAVAWGDSAERPTETRKIEMVGDWYEDLAKLEAVILQPLQDSEMIPAALNAEGIPEVRAAAEGTLHARDLLWSARQTDAARRASND